MLVNYFRMFHLLAIGPRRFFPDCLDGRYLRESIFTFVAGAAYTFAKSFSIEANASIFSTNDFLKNLQDVLNNIQFKWLSAYVCFTASMFWAYQIAKRLRAEVSFSTNISIGMSVAALGFAGRLVVDVVGVFANSTVVSVLSYSLACWLFLISEYAFTRVLNLSSGRALIPYAVSSLCAFLAVGLPGVFPYLSWVN